MDVGGGLWGFQACGGMLRASDLLMTKGDFDEAEALCSESLAGYRATRGERHPDTMAAGRTYALLQKKMSMIKAYDERVRLVRVRLGSNRWEHSLDWEEIAMVAAPRRPWLRCWQGSTVPQHHVLWLGRPLQVGFKQLYDHLRKKIGRHDEEKPTPSGQLPHTPKGALPRTAGSAGKRLPYGLDTSTQPVRFQRASSHT